MAVTAPVSPHPPDVTEDALLGGRVRLLQPAGGYRAAVDPVLLAAAVPAAAGEHVLDLGCGTGAAALCLAARVPGCRVTGLELLPDVAALAERSAGLSGLADRVRVLAGDLRAPPAALAEIRFDRVMMNPPYHPAGGHTPSADTHKATAHGESAGQAGLADWVRAALRLMAARGTLTLIHRADRLGEVLGLLEGRFGGIVVLPLWPRAGEPAKRVIVQARRNARAPLTLAAGLALHTTDGRFTDAAEAVLRQGRPLAL